MTITINVKSGTGGHYDYNGCDLRIKEIGDSMENTYFEIQTKQDDIYFKMHCLYNAKTEMYDRTLTDRRRDRYDPTSADIDCSHEVRRASNQYAYGLYLWCKRNIEYETGQPFDAYLWKDCVRGYHHLSAQGWIDLYEYLVENGEFELKESKTNENL